MVFEIKPKAPRPENVAAPEEGVAERDPVKVDPPVIATVIAVA